MNIKNWDVATLNKENAKEISNKYGISSLPAMLFDIRGFTTSEEIEEFANDYTPLSDPFLMKDMDKAVTRIHRAIEEFEKIVVYGDYDADGITATSILFTYLEANGADVMYYIPQREGEGYGMNINAVENLHSQGVSLIITVDNGISSVKEVRRANELGVDVVITDHHRVQKELPEAVAVVDAYRQDCESPFKDLCGAGVALKLIMALDGGNSDEILEEFADLAALGTIGDVVPMVGENRTIVKAGLRALERGDRLGISALLENASISSGVISATSLAFTVIPRINAAGRMGSPERAVQLLICDDEEEANDRAKEICSDNDERRAVEAGISDEVMAKIESNPVLKYARVIVVDGRDWHHGVIGIVASRIVDRYGKPCMVISSDEHDAKGSGRSVAGFSLFEAITNCEDLLEKFGGHPMAAGINLKAENIDKFRTKINEYAAMKFSEMPAQSIKLDCKLNPSSLSPDMPQELKILEPYGCDNPQPLFGLYGVEISEITPVGDCGGHLRLNCKREGKNISCMRFGMKLEEFPYFVGSVVDLAVTLDAREYRGEAQLTISIKDMKLSELNVPESIHSFRVYEKIQNEEKISEIDSVLVKPTREDLVILYKFIKTKLVKVFSVQSAIGIFGSENFNVGKLLLCIDIFNERKLVKCEIKGDIISASALEMDRKVDIFTSSIFEKIEVLTK